MTSAENGINVVGTEKQAQRRRNCDKNENRNQRQRHLERRQSGVQQGNVAHILMIADGIPDAVIVMMRFAIVMMIVRVLVGDFGRSNVPGLICVNVGTA